MNGAQLHLAINHLPLAGALFATIVLFFGIIRSNFTVIRTGLALGILAAVLSIPTFLSGEPAEKFLKAFTTVPKGLIHPHEEFAETSFIVLLLSGAIAAFAVWASLRRPRVERIAIWTAFVGFAVSVGMMAWTAHLGGLIRHDELRVESPAVP